jgi:hypothetical protein
VLYCSDACRAKKTVRTTHSKASND